jgi:preprotein translocase subunit SecE
MGRLLRKKGPNHKKKKKQDSDLTEVTPQKKEKTVFKSVPFLSGISKKPDEKQNSTKAVLIRRSGEPGKVKVVIDKTSQFLREVRVELNKVAWPSRKQTLGSTIVVLILVLIISFFLGIVDVGLASIIRLVFQ